MFVYRLLAIADAVVAKLRAQLDIPVWSSIQATAWAGTGALTAHGLPVRLMADAYAP